MTEQKSLEENSQINFSNAMDRIPFLREINVTKNKDNNYYRNDDNNDNNKSRSSSRERNNHFHNLSNIKNKFDGEKSSNENWIGGRSHPSKVESALEFLAISASNSINFEISSTKTQNSILKSNIGTPSNINDNSNNGNNNIKNNNSNQIKSKGEQEKDNFFYLLAAVEAAKGNMEAFAYVLSDIEQAVIRANKLKNQQNKNKFNSLQILEYLRSDLEDVMCSKRGRVVNELVLTPFGCQLICHNDIN